MFLHIHPHKPFIKNNSTKLIVGTLPPPRFSTKELKPKDVNFCYGSCDGLLWKALDEIYSLNLLYENTKEAINLRKEFLIKNKIGICDIVHSCKREKIDASDLAMKEVKLIDLLSYLKKFKNINTLIFTGGNSKNGPEYFFRQVLKQNNITFNIVSKEIPKVHEFIYEERVIKTVSLTSPSNAANRFIGSKEEYKRNKKQNPNYTTFDFRVKQYKKVFSLN
jgi:G:T/U-mismatch repair DNA glycosylase